jgi:hypothetical protein
MPLNTDSLPSGTTDGTTWTGKVAETFSKAVYGKMHDHYLLSKVSRVPAASAFNLRSITTYSPAAVGAEGATVAETDMKVDLSNKDLSTFRALQKISLELIGDSDALEVVAKALADEVLEAISIACIDAVEAASFDTASGTYRDNVATGGITNGVPTQQALLSLAYGSSGALNGLAAGSRFTQEQRKRVIMLMSGDTVSEWLRTTVTGNLASLFDSDEGMVSFAGIPVCTCKGLLANAATDVGQLHVVCVDPTQIILAEQPLVVSVDTESLMQNNQVLVSASMRAAAFLTSRLHATGLTLRTMTGGSVSIVED